VQQTPRLCKSLLSLLLIGALTSLWAQVSWKTTPLPRWSEVEAKQILTDSPWVKSTVPGMVRDLSEFERRDGGDWDADIGRGVGLLALLGGDEELIAMLRAHMKPPNPAVIVRWESALPVREAERRAGITDAPDLLSDNYAIVVYDIPTPKKWNFEHELRGVAFLKRDRKKDIHPSGVRILRHNDGTANIVYLFPRAVEIGKKDGRVEFQAQVGRLVVDQNFFTEDMQLQGELQVLMPSETPHSK
jgi:hypothetical protein